MLSIYIFKYERANIAFFLLQTTFNLKYFLLIVRNGLIFHLYEVLHFTKAVLFNGLKEYQNSMSQDSDQSI